MGNLTFKGYVNERLKSKPFLTIIALYLLFCIISTIYFGSMFRVKDCVMSLAFTLFALLVFLVEYFIRIRFGSLFLVGALTIASGSILGSCYNLYSMIPFFDTVLHGLSGLLFAGLGYALMDKMISGNTTKDNFFAKLLFAFCFSLAVAVVWEIFEYICTTLLGIDMMEDTIIHNIISYFLSGSHSETVDINGIDKTIIYYGDQLNYVIDGYLDIGLIDTMNDIIICTIGAIGFCALSILSRYKMPSINRALIPQNLSYKNREEIYIS